MENAIWTMVTAALLGMAWLAYHNPLGYQRLSLTLLTIFMPLSLIAAGWQTGLDMLIGGLQPIIAPEKRAAAAAIKGGMSVPPHVIIGAFAFLFYMYVLRYFHRLKGDEVAK